MDQLFEQLQQFLGKPIETEDPTALDQCMDWAFKWCDILGIDRATIRHYYAFQVWKQPIDLTVQYFNFIPNTPNGVPPRGSLVIFDQNVAGVTGIAGHICIATGEGDSNTFKSYDQNWNGVQHVTEEQHTYLGVLGWIFPWKFHSLQVQLENKNVQYDQLYNADQANLHLISQQKDQLQQLQIAFDQYKEMHPDGPNQPIINLSDTASNNSIAIETLSNQEKQNIFQAFLNVLKTL